MPSLTEKLESLGVKIGVQEIKTPPAKNRFAIENIVDGRLQATPHGDTFLVDQTFPIDTPHGCHTLRIDAPLDLIATWANDARLAERRPSSFCFLDTETTGLGFGAGTLAFMVGVARYEGQSFHLAQFFVRDPAEETAMLAALSDFIAPCAVLVTFNGKCFDAPLLETRYRLNQLASPLTTLAHLDLLPLARRLWRDRLPSRALGSLEEHILRLPRSGQDVPGWLIPELYFDYLQSGDARPLKGVFYHNQIDVLSMAALLGHIAGLLADPDQEHIPSLDVMAMGKLFEAMAQTEQAVRLYRLSLERGLPTEVHNKTIERLSLIHKRSKAWTQAIDLWQKAANAGQIYAHVELAKYYEHKTKQIEQAIHWTQAAIARVHAPDRPLWERDAALAELEHRLARLRKKLAR